MRQSAVSVRSLMTCKVEPMSAPDDLVFTRKRFDEMTSDECITMSALFFRLAAMRLPPQPEPTPKPPRKVRRAALT